VKVLLDTCVAPRAIDQLEAAGHDVVWIGHESDPGDEEILDCAFKEERVLVTTVSEHRLVRVRHFSQNREKPSNIYRA